MGGEIVDYSGGLVGSWWKTPGSGSSSDGGAGSGSEIGSFVTGVAGGSEGSSGASWIPEFGWRGSTGLTIPAVGRICGRAGDGMGFWRGGGVSPPRCKTRG